MRNKIVDVLPWAEKPEMAGASLLYEHHSGGRTKQQGSDRRDQSRRNREVGPCLGEAYWRTSAGTFNGANPTFDHASEGLTLGR